jgi:hypothetical protein
MRLTVIRNDGAVYVDSVAYLSLDMSSVPTNVHALQWYEVSGWIEFADSTPNQDITELPAWANVCVEEWEAADYAQKHPPQHSPTVEENKQAATSLLSQTDWTALPDVADPLKSNPYLANASAFNIYRNAVRLIAINPTAGDLDWPTKPNADWQTSE